MFIFGVDIVGYIRLEILFNGGFFKKFFVSSIKVIVQKPKGTFLDFFF